MPPSSHGLVFPCCAAAASPLPASAAVNAEHMLCALYVHWSLHTRQSALAHSLLPPPHCRSVDPPRFAVLSVLARSCAAELATSTDCVLASFRRLNACDPPHESRMVQTQRSANYQLRCCAAAVAPATCNVCNAVLCTAASVSCACLFFCLHPCGVASRGQ